MSDHESNTPAYGLENDTPDSSLWEQCIDTPSRDSSPPPKDEKLAIAPRLHSLAYKGTSRHVLSEFRRREHERKMQNKVPSAKFQYNRRLSGREIRLLQIQSQNSDKEGTLFCQLKEFSWENAPPYEALSYTWGKPKPTDTILFNGKPMEVTRNLRDGISCFKFGAWIWADAICINQHDWEEKTEQVRMMRDIYQNATGVAVWLGSEAAGDLEGAKLLENLHRDFSRDDLAFGGNLDITKYGYTEPDISHGQEAWHSLYGIYARPWFSRVWVLQEVLVAKNATFYSGSIAMPMEAILGVALTLMKSRNMVLPWANFERSRQGTNPPVLYAGKLAYLRQALRDHGAMSLQTTLQITKAFEATDIRDNIFALVGLCSNAGPEFIDYGKGIDTILIELSRNDFTSPGSGQRDVLSFANLSSSKSAGVPSWVRALHFDRPNFSPLCAVYPSEAIQCMPNNEDLELYFGSGKEDALYLKGKILDTVYETTTCFPSPVSTESIVNPAIARKLHMWLSSCERLSIDSDSRTQRKIAKRYSRQPLEEVFWRSMAFNTLYPRERATASVSDSYRAYRRVLRHYYRLAGGWRDYAHLAGFLLFSCVLMAPSGTIILLSISFQKLVGWATPVEYLWDLISARVLILLVIIGLLLLTRRGTIFTELTLIPYKCFFAPSQGQLAHMVKESERFSEILQTFGPERKFCVTKNGHVGWVHESCRPGDRVCTIEGSRLPFTIRPLGDQVDTNAWQLVGDSYLHGLMDGEVMRYWRNNELEEIKLV